MHELRNAMNKVNMKQLSNLTLFALFILFSDMEWNKKDVSNSISRYLERIKCFRVVTKS